MIKVVPAFMEISIHPPREGRDFCDGLTHEQIAISIHPPREGRDPPCPPLLEAGAGFQSTRPVRGGTGAFPVEKILDNGFQSTRPVRGGTEQVGTKRPSSFISIHPPREGRDRRIVQPSLVSVVYSAQTSQPLPTLFYIFMSGSLVCPNAFEVLHRKFSANLLRILRLLPLRTDQTIRTPSAS